jgi:hypothetical protein
MLEEHYILSLSPFVRNFKKSGKIHQFSCVECEDYKWQPTNPRANIYYDSSAGGWFYHCYRCGAHYPFSYFLKKHFPNLYEDWVFESFGKRVRKKTDDVDPDMFKTSKPKFRTDRSLKHLLHLNADMDHPAVDYLKGRGLDEFINLFYYTDNYKKFVNDHLIPEKFASVDKPDERVVLPFFNRNKEFLGVQGRALDKNARVRYITAKVAPDEVPMIFGMDRVDLMKPIYVLEGPIDSLFIENAVAWAGGSLQSVTGVPNAVLVWDNEPYADQMHKQIRKAINNGSKVVIWEKKNKFKDINDMIQGGMNITADYLASRTFEGLEAELEFDMWRKV